MQITLVQAEIEAAIKQYVLGHLAINAGMEIAIKLSATRGADGMTAAVDIIPSANPPAIAAPAVVAAVQAQPEVLRQQPFVPAVVPVASTAPVAVQTTQETGQKDPGGFQEDPPVSERILPVAAAQESSAPAGEPAAEDSGEQPATQPPGRALFRGLRRPANS